MDEDGDGEDLIISLIQELAGTIVKVYLNPTVQELNIEAGGHFIYQVSLTDLLGNKMWEV